MAFTTIVDGIVVGNRGRITGTITSIAITIGTMMMMVMVSITIGVTVTISIAAAPMVLVLVVQEVLVQVTRTDCLATRTGSTIYTTTVYRYLSLVQHVQVRLGPEDVVRRAGIQAGHHCRGGARGRGGAAWGLNTAIAYR